jgi:predicted signal transduction protein with EAL and GGDEF domain
VGVAIYPEHGEDMASLMSHADEAMYQAKTNGKDQVWYYSVRGTAASSFFVDPALPLKHA